MLIPVPLNALGILLHTFAECYMSQVSASFLSYEYDGVFREFTQKVWVEQLRQIQLLVGKNFFYENDHPLIRATHGMIYARLMGVDEFVALADELELLTEGLAGVY